MESPRDGIIPAKPSPNISEPIHINTTVIILKIVLTFNFNVVLYTKYITTIASKIPRSEPAIIGIGEEVKRED